MQTYISLLRGINVSGQKKITMAELRGVYENCGFKNVQSYIQSGNILFDAPIIHVPELKDMLERAILDHFGYHVDVILRSPELFLMLLSQNPFLNRKKIDIKKLHVTFFETNPADETIQTLDGGMYHPDVFILTPTHVFVYCSNGYGRTKINNTFFEKKLRIKTTTRNWNTINKLSLLIKDR